MRKNVIYFMAAAFGLAAVGPVLVSCEEEGLLVNDNTVSYLTFGRNMTQDTTTVSFQMYNEGVDAVIPIEVRISGKLQAEDLPFTVSSDEGRTTLDKSLYELPARCVMRGGLLTDTIYVTLKNDPSLRTQTKLLALKFDEREGVRTGDRRYARALIAVTDRLFKPDWWSVNDMGTDDYFANSVEDYYLGAYSETKYKMFLDELKKDGATFDGSNRQVLRKYALRLKNTLATMNAGKPESEWVKDENGVVITLPVAG